MGRIITYLLLFVCVKSSLYCICNMTKIYFSTIALKNKFYFYNPHDLLLNKCSSNLIKAWKRALPAEMFSKYQGCHPKEHMDKQQCQWHKCAHDAFPLPLQIQRHNSYKMTECYSILEGFTALTSMLLTVILEIEPQTDQFRKGTDFHFVFFI